MMDKEIESGQQCWKIGAVNQNLSSQVLLICEPKLLLILIFLIKAGLCSVSQAAAVAIPPIIAAPTGSPVIPDLNQYNACSRIPLGGYGVNSSGFTFTVIRYCDSGATEVMPFVHAGWGIYNNCTSYNSSYRHPADTCNGYWPTLPGKAAECPTGYSLSLGMCNPTGSPPITLFKLL
jgi:hypothetical protein